MGYCRKARKHGPCLWRFSGYKYFSCIAMSWAAFWSELPVNKLASLIAQTASGGTSWLGVWVDSHLCDRVRLFYFRPGETVPPLSPHTRELYCHLCRRREVMLAQYRFAMVLLWSGFHLSEGKVDRWIMTCIWAEEANKFVAYPFNCVYLLNYILHEYSEMLSLSNTFLPTLWLPVQSATL